MVRPIAAAFIAAIVSYSPTPALAVAGSDFSKDAPDVFCSARVVDISILGSSSVRQFDRAALGAVARGSYRPRQLLCTPIPGFYSLCVNYYSP